MSPASETDTLEQFKDDLRELRSRAGNPTLEALARRTGVSKTVLSDAFAGKRLPTERTVVAVVRELDGDVDRFAARRAGLDPVPREPVAQVGATRSDPVRGRSVSATFATVLAVLTGVVGIVVGAAGADLAGWPSKPAAALARTSPDPATPSPTGASNGARVVVASGLDPATTECVQDAAVAASETRTHDTLLEIIWSDACQAGWARITRYDGKAAGNVVSASIYRQVAPNGGDRQDTTEPGVEGAYTTLLVRPTPDTRLCAVGEITLDGKHVSLGAPMCL